MSRYVKPIVEGVAKQQAGGDGQLQEYFKRVASYIPDRITAFYAAGVGAAAAETDAGLRVWLEAIVLIVAFIFAGIQLYREGKNDPAKFRRIQIGIAMVAFLIWAYSLNTGIVAEFHLYHMAIALLLLFVFTFAIGSYKPKVPAPPPEPPQTPAGAN